MKKYPIRLKEVRESKKLKQSEIAEMINVTTRHYQDMEYGKINIPMMTLKTLADFYDVSIDYLMFRTDNPRITT